MDSIYRVFVGHKINILGDINIIHSTTIKLVHIGESYRLYEAANAARGIEIVCLSDFSHSLLAVSIFQISESSQI